MADELAVVVKTKLEIDEQQFRKDTERLSDIKTPVKIPVEADKDSFGSSLSALQKNPPTINIKVNTDDIVKTIREKLNSAKFSIKVDSHAIANEISTATEKASKKVSSSVIGIDPKEIAGSQKYIDKLIEKANQFKQSFTDATSKISDTQIIYKPIEKMYQASVKYEDSIGRTTSMVFSLNEGMEDVSVTQLKLTDNEKKFRAEIEKTLACLNKQESAYNDLVSKAFKQKNKLSDDSGAPDAYGLVAQSALDLYKAQIDEIRNQGAAVTAEQERNLEKLRANADRVIREQKDAKWGATDFAAKDVSKQVELEQKKIAAVIKKYDDAGFSFIETVQKLNSLELDLSDITNIDDLNKWRENLKLAQADIDAFMTSANGKAIQTSFDIKSGQVAKIDSMLGNEAISSKQTAGVARLRTELQQLRTEYSSIQSEISDFVNQGKIFNAADLQNYNDKLNKLDQRLASAAKQAKVFNGSIASNDIIEKARMQIDKLKNDLDTMEINWSKALEIPELKADINSMRMALENADALSLPNLQKAFIELRSKIKAAGADCKSFGDKLNDAFDKLKSYFSLTELFQYARETAREMITAVKEIDSAMTELKKVADLSQSGYDKYLDSAAIQAKKIGINLHEYIAGTADFAKVGYSVADAQTMAEQVSMLYKVGDGFTKIEEASDAVIASMAAYGLKVSDVTSIVDKFNKVSNDTSIDTVGLTDAITRSASALAISGLNLDRSLALIVAGNETTRNAAAVGNALKSLSMRIRGAESDLAAAGEETDEYTKSTSKLRGEIKELTGVDIMKNEREFKDLYDVMNEISVAYKSLADIDKANVTEILFGKQRAQVGASILLNFNKAEKALQSAQDSAGSAMTEHERWAQSIEASEARATAAFQEFSTTVMSSDLIKFTFDMQTGLLGFLTNIIDKLGAIPALAATVAGALSFKNFGISKMNMPYPTCLSAVA